MGPLKGIKIIDSNNLEGDTIDLRIKNQVILSNE